MHAAALPSNMAGAQVAPEKYTPHQTFCGKEANFGRIRVTRTARRRTPLLVTASSTKRYLKEKPFLIPSSKDERLTNGTPRGFQRPCTEGPCGIPLRG